MRAIETGLFSIPGVPGELEALNVAGVRGHVAPHVSDGLVNNVGDFNLPDTKVESTLDEIRARYRALGNPAQWWIGPSAKPAGIVPALEARGIQYTDAIDGLVSTDLQAAFSLNPKVRVETISQAGIESLGKTFSAGFVFDDDPLPNQAGILWLTAMQSAPPHRYGRNYAAHLEGVDGAIAAASLILLPDTDIALLAGASTLPEHRGNGAYTALVAA